jgi:hypothetical protein
MITIKKISIYSYFSGDIDGWARAGSPEQKNEMKDSDWFLVENLIQDILLESEGLCSENFIQNLNEKMLNNCENESVIQELRRIALTT